MIRFALALLFVLPGLAQAGPVEECGKSISHDLYDALGRPLALSALSGHLTRPAAGLVPIPNEYSGLIRALAGAYAMLQRNLHHCLLGILQRGVTEARSLALQGKTSQAAELLDALDGIPRHLAKWTSTSALEIRQQLESFTARAPGNATDFLQILDGRIDLLSEDMP